MWSTKGMHWTGRERKNENVMRKLRHHPQYIEVIGVFEPAR
jgi:hypothetical protein